MDSVDIRAYRADDLASILQLTVAAFEGVSIDHLIEQQLGVMEPGWQERKLSDVKNAAANEPTGIFVAVGGDRVVGYVTVSLSKHKSIGRIADLAVDAQMRNHGIGRRLLDQALAYIKASGMQFAKIETLDVNEIGQALYPKLGFTEIARQIHYVMRFE